PLGQDLGRAATNYPLGAARSEGLPPEMEPPARAAWPAPGRPLPSHPPAGPPRAATDRPKHNDAERRHEPDDQTQALRIALALCGLPLELSRAAKRHRLERIVSLLTP